MNSSNKPSSSTSCSFSYFFSHLLSRSHQRQRQRRPSMEHGLDVNSNQANKVFPNKGGYPLMKSIFNNITLKSLGGKMKKTNVYNSKDPSSTPVKDNNTVYQQYQQHKSLEGSVVHDQANNKCNCSICNAVVVKEDDEMKQEFSSNNKSKEMTIMISQPICYESSGVSLSSSVISEEAKQVVKTVADIFMRRCYQSSIEDHLLLWPVGTTSEFIGKRLPRISIANYLARLVVMLSWTYNKSEVFIDLQCVGIRVMVLSLIYMGRILELNDGFEITKYNVHRLLLATMIAGISFTEDLSPNRTILASIGGISVKQVCKMENKLCALMEYKYWVKREEYLEVFKHILIESNLSTDHMGNIIEAADWMEC